MRVPISSLPEQRVSTAMGYLTEEVRRRANLRILANAHVVEILFDGDPASGIRATGVRIRRGDAAEDHTGAEIVLSAGTLQTPAMLLRAGIGPAADLQKLGIEVRADLPGVGANLQDHPACP